MSNFVVLWSIVLPQLLIYVMRITVILICFSNLLFAEQHEQVPTPEPIIISSDESIIDLATKQATYKGNVLVERGDIRIEAQEVQFRQTETSQTFISTGDPAQIFWLSTEVADLQNTATAKQIDYVSSNEQTLFMKGDVQVQVDGNTIESEEIFYNLSTERLEASGNSKRRVKFVIQLD